MIDRLTVILRHNTLMPGDAELAQREWEALVGARGVPLSEFDFAAMHPASSAVGRPLYASAFPWVAATWTNVSHSAADRLVRRSAFAQEVFIETGEAGPAGISKAICCAYGLLKPTHVALAHNYIIESEAALPADHTIGRIAATIKALLEVYVGGRESSPARRLRAAKKTTLSLSHDLHIYKAKFFPRMVRALINIYGQGAVVFDPFCGSGTALLEASLLGQDSIGIDIDPICEMMSRSKVEPFVSDRAKVREGLYTFRATIAAGATSESFEFPEELRLKIARRDRIEKTDFLRSIQREANVLATSVKGTGVGGITADLIRTLASDAVTKKIRYRFVGVGNGRYTIEIVKQPLLERLNEKIDRSLQLLDVFDELETELGITLGKVQVVQGDARSNDTWPTPTEISFIVTSPPYLPASSGREHYAASRALAFAVLGYDAGKNGYFDNANSVNLLQEFPANTEAGRLMTYLFSDAKDNPDPQKDAMRFERKAVPTSHYLKDITRFGSGLTDALGGSIMAMVVADRHMFYSHRRSEVEHVVDCAMLYGELLHEVGLDLREEIELQLLKSAASRARPRAKDDYHEAVLIFSVGSTISNSPVSDRNSSPPDLLCQYN